jgi:hypothetical protein
MGDSKLSDRPKLAVSDPPLIWPARGPAPNRHGAIARQLVTYSHYKSWAERTRNAWQKEDEAAAEVPPPAR